MKYQIRPGLVWRSTPESIAAGAVSVVAVAEVFFSVAFFLWIYIAFDRLWLLWAGLIIAPAVLLRSPQSVETAAGMWERYTQSEDIPLRSPRRAMSIALSAAVFFAAAWTLSKYLLIDHQGWSWFWRAALIGWLAFQAGLATGATTIGLKTVAATAGLATAAVAAFEWAGTAINLVGWTAGWAAADVVGVILAAAGLVAALFAAAVGFVASAGLALAAAVGVAAAAAAESLGAAIFFPGLLIGAWLRSLIIRFTSVMAHLPAGLPQIPANWRRAILAEDMFHWPELLPGVGARAESLETLVSGWRSGGGVEKIAAIIAIPLIFGPALLWRYSLKATAWFYWPLVFISTRKDS